MKPIDCARCSQLKTRVDIDGPTVLMNVLRWLHARLADHTLLPHGAAPSSGGAEFPFASVPVEGPWPDYLHYRFRCTACEARFQLSVETYHGAGGAWVPET